MLPLVESMRILSGVRRPSASASCIMRSAARSFTLPPGFANSSLAYTSTSGALGRDAAQANERRVADRVDDRIEALHPMRHDLPSSSPPQRARACAERAPRGARGIERSSKPAVVEPCSASYARPIVDARVTAAPPPPRPSARPILARTALRPCAASPAPARVDRCARCACPSRRSRRGASGRECDSQCASAARASPGRC